jgi:hypothetical protein
MKTKNPNKIRRPSKPTFTKERVKTSSHFLPLNLKTQAGRVIAKFGSAYKLAQALEAVGAPRHPTVIYRWDKPVAQGGTGGLIPLKALGDIQRAARHEGILLTDKDMSPIEH